MQVGISGFCTSQLGKYLLTDISAKDFCRNKDTFYNDDWFLNACMQLLLFLLIKMCNNMMG